MNLIKLIYRFRFIALITVIGLFVQGCGIGSHYITSSPSGGIVYKLCPAPAKKPNANMLEQKGTTPYKFTDPASAWYQIRKQEYEDSDIVFFPWKALGTAKKHFVLKPISRMENAESISEISKKESDFVFKPKPNKKSEKPLPESTLNRKQQERNVGMRFAVIIGISQYEDTRIPSLRYAARDAKEFYNWVVSKSGGKYSPSRVKLLIGQAATAINIKDSLFVWLKQALEEDIVTIYFAGHGSPESPDSPHNLYFLPYDARYDKISTTGFPMWDIETALKRFIKSKKVIMIADACHAGGVGQAFDIARRNNRAIKVNLISSGLQNLSKVGDGVCIISASDEKQLSQEGKKWGGGHGVFTYFLLRGLHGEADYNSDSLVTLGELIPYLSEQVRRATKNAQCPIVAGRFDPALSLGK